MRRRREWREAGRRNGGRLFFEIVSSKIRSYQASLEREGTAREGTREGMRTRASRAGSSRRTGATPLGTNSATPVSSHGDKVEPQWEGATRAKIVTAGPAEGRGVAGWIARVITLHAAELAQAALATGARVAVSALVMLLRICCGAPRIM